jgi:glycosyltransferase involved in cell wall biosynthesis
MPAPDLLISVIIPTIGRASLARAVESALNQDCERGFEVIVVNDSGRPLAEAGWQRSPRVRVVDTMQRERCVARNSGAAVARGQYCNFLDDDDWLLPGALSTLARLSDKSEAAWLYGSSQLTDENGRVLYQFDHQLTGNCFTQLVAGEWVPLQASLIKADVFWEVGAFDPVYLITQDKDLLMQVGLRYGLAGTSVPVVGILRGVWETSTDYGSTSENWRAACEKALAPPEAPARLRGSATSAYWHGRWLRAYLLSVLWNARHGRLFLLWARLWQAAVALALAGTRLLSADFWRALARSHLTMGHAPSAAGQARRASTRPAE